MSTMPISRITTNSGVASFTPSCTTKNYSPSKVGEIFMCLRIQLSAGLATDRAVNHVIDSPGLA
jgi:hypothetical protein